MRKVVCFLIAGAVGLGAWCRPLLMGHRGSDIGLENSVESFTNGAKRGYEYLETDWKLTKDKQFVCSHDDDTKRLGGTLTLAGSTLAELQAETLSQTRNGVKYTGRLCSAKEYLDVCRQYNVRPLIELKWTTGINSNDCSNIPMLIKFIEDNGFRNECIILTSMKPCLEYIRKNYPDIKLQFLTGQYWANHFDWCVEQGIDVDIQTGYFDKATVDKFHDAGLNVNIWTVNANDMYKKYGDWGVDMVTTDKLDPTTLPELDPMSAIRPNKVDYPETAASPRGWFLPRLDKSAEWPAAIASDAVRAMVYGRGGWLVLADGEGASLIHSIGADGRPVSAIAAPAQLSDIACGIDGAVYGISGDGVCVWSKPGASAAPIWQADGALDASTLRIAVSGTSANGYLYIAGAAGDGEPLQLTVLNLHGTAQAQSAATVPFPSGVTPAQLGDYRIVVTPTARENILLESSLAAAVEYRFEREGTPRLDVYATSADASGAMGRSYARRGIKAYGMVPDAEGGFSAVFADFSAGLAAPAAACDPLVPDFEGSSALTSTAIDLATNRLLIAGAGAGFRSFVLDTYAANPEPEDAEIQIERVWLNSLSGGNAPQHIHGSNAQQGTAVNGLFYVNDCVDRLIYVFDQTGCIGSMPGGAGWGCCRDDRGNIIVRDDKLTADKHSFLVYPAGSTPDCHPAATRIEATVPLVGQTNFINASGDVLGELGYIYLYPNKQTAVNVIRLSGGEVRAATASGELTMTGSTAGYVVPVDNNSEDWLYHVRAYGIGRYAGGETSDVMSGRGTTTAPARNTTGGCARFVLRGNVLLAHNSGTNYVGGFTLRNLSRDQAVIRSFDPIGDMGYKDGGNYSTFNWLIPEAIDDNSAWLYQYTPANGMGLYRVSVKDQGVDTLGAGAAGASRIVRCGDMLTAEGGDAGLSVYDMGGALVVAATGRSVSIANLPAGAYIARSARASLKFVK